MSPAPTSAELARLGSASGWSCTVRRAIVVGTWAGMNDDMMTSCGGVFPPHKLFYGERAFRFQSRVFFPEFRGRIPRELGDL